MQIIINIQINVPVIFQYEHTNLIEIIKEEQFGYTSQFSIYHPDGTYLAKVTGNRSYPTEEGKKAGIKTEQHEGLWVCKMNNKILYEIRQQTGDAFKTNAELFTPDGYFIKIADAPQPHLIDNNGRALQIGGMTLAGNVFSNCRIGIWLRKDGSISLCA